VPLLPLLPILVPLAGILICLIAKRRIDGNPSVRIIYVTAIAATALSLLGAWALGANTAAVPVSSHRYLSIPSAPLWTPLGYWAATLLLAMLLLGQLVGPKRPMTRARCGIFLAFLAAAMATVSASNTVSLLLAWSIPLWLVLYLRTTSGDDAEHLSRWDVWASWASIGLLILGVTAWSREQADVLDLVTIGPGLAFSAMGLAAALRLFSWPLASGPGRWWQLHAMSLITGFVLWLRLGIALDITTSLIPASGTVAAAFLAVGLLVGPHDDRSSVLPYGLGYWLALSLLAPLLDPQRGFAVSLLIATQLIACFLAFHIYTVSRDSTWLAQCPRLAAWAALSGLPLTSGFVVHWVFAQICLGTGRPDLLFVASIGYLLVAIPVWRRFQGLSKELPARLSLQRPGRPVDLVLLVPAALLVLLGFWPHLLGTLWPNMGLGLEALQHGQLWGDSFQERFSLLVATLLIPMAGSLLASQRAEGLLESGHRALERARQGIGMGWLYLLVEQLLDRVLAALRKGLENVEEALPLGWTLLWTLALVYYLVVR
jgi:hypothetical protein